MKGRQESETSVENEILGLFMSLSQVFGLPKSVGAIYGLLFAAESPLPFDEIATGLHLSGGSVSQGLRALKAIGAVKVTFVSGDRRDHYLAETRLRYLVSGFLRGEVETHLADAEERLFRLEELVRTRDEHRTSASQLSDYRVHTLRNWHSRAKSVLPALLNILDNPQDFD